MRARGWMRRERRRCGMDVGRRRVLDLPRKKEDTDTMRKEMHFLEISIHIRRFRAFARSRV